MAVPSINEENVVNDKSREDPVNRIIISRCNKAFFIAAMMAELQSVRFEDALYRGQHQPATYAFMHAGYPCRMIVNAVPLHHLTDVTFLADVKKAVNDAIDQIPKGIYGDLNDKVRVRSGLYYLEFFTTGYWCTKSPDADLVEDPTQFPLGEQLGREVELKISLAA